MIMNLDLITEINRLIDKSIITAADVICISFFLSFQYTQDALRSLFLNPYFLIIINCIVILSYISCLVL